VVRAAVTHLVKRLSRLSRDALVAHFTALAPADLRLRFGMLKSPQAIAEYVDGIDYDQDAVFGVFDDELRLVGVAHVGRMPDGTAEFGVSVLPEWRGRGIGTVLFERANAYARNQLIRQLFVHCLTENKAMMHIARKADMRIVVESGEADAYLSLPPTDAATIAQELIDERVALFDVALKAQLVAAKRLAARMRGEEP
jgi:RimJ/RimL family protein N-acetyltransferase